MPVEAETYKIYKAVIEHGALTVHEATVKQPAKQLKIIDGRTAPWGYNTMLYMRRSYPRTEEEAIVELIDGLNAELNRAVDAVEAATRKRMIAETQLAILTSTLRERKGE